MDYEYYRDFHEYLNFGVNIAFVHYHKAIETVYVFEGHLKITIGDEVYILRKGDFALIPPYSPHILDPNNTAQSQINIIPPIYSDQYMQAFSSSRPASFVIRDKEIAGDIAQHLRLLLQKPSDLLKKGIYYYCIAKFIDNARKNVIEISKAEAKQSTLFYDILIYIDEHSAEELTLEILSKKFNYSKFYFSSMFNRHLGTNLKNYINNVRIKKAIELLYDHSVNETSSLVGYANLQSFFYNFKKITKHSPKDYVRRIAGTPHEENIPDSLPL